MAYNEIDIYFDDLNWYFLDQYNRVCVVASAGGILPRPIMQNDERNERFHQIVVEMPQIYKVGRNPNVLQIMQGIEAENLDLYFRNFEDLASKGLYVFDKINIANPEDGLNMLVAYPIYDTENDDFPFDRDSLFLIPKIDNAIISRRNQKLLPASFDQINLIELVDRAQYNS